MDRAQVVSPLLLIAILLALAVEGARVFGDHPTKDEVQAPVSEPDAPAPMPPPPNWDPAWRYERRMA